MYISTIEQLPQDLILEDVYGICLSEYKSGLIKNDPYKNILKQAEEMGANALIGIKFFSVDGRIYIYGTAAKVLHG